MGQGLQLAGEVGARGQARQQERGQVAVGEGRGQEGPKPAMEQEKAGQREEEGRQRAWGRQVVGRESQVALPAQPPAAAPLPP